MCNNIKSLGSAFLFEQMNIQCLLIADNFTDIFISTL